MNYSNKTFSNNLLIKLHVFWWSCQHIWITSCNFHVLLLKFDGHSMIKQKHTQKVVVLRSVGHSELSKWFYIRGFLIFKTKYTQKFRFSNWAFVKVLNFLNLWIYLCYNCWIFVSIYNLFCSPIQTDRQTNL